MATGHEPRLRWPMLVIGGIAAVLLIVALVVGATLLLRVLAPSSGSPLPPRDATGSPDGNQPSGNPEATSAAATTGELIPLIHLGPGGRG